MNYIYEILKKSIPELEWIDSKTIHSLKKGKGKCFFISEKVNLHSFDESYHTFYFTQDTIDSISYYSKICIIVDPVSISKKVNWNIIDEVIVIGDKIHTLKYEDIISVQKQCMEKNVSFTFLSTGDYLEKDHKVYHIPEAKQIEQANKASLSFEKIWSKDPLYKRIGKSKFRSRFHLSDKDIEYINEKGMDTIERHGYDLLSKRLVVFDPEKDGKQTPLKGHPIFIAQHATGCCCRGCLEKWHGISKNHDLSKEELEYIIHICVNWIDIEVNKCKGLH